MTTKIPTIDIVVTRHPALVTLLRERGMITEDTPIITHATRADVLGKHVLGVLPHHLSSAAASITEIPFRWTEADREAMSRGDVDLDGTRRAAGDPVTYVCTAVADHCSPSLAMAAAIRHCEGFNGVVDGPMVGIGPDTWRGLGVMYFASMCQQFSVAVVLARGIWRKRQPDGPWLDGLGLEVDVDTVEPASGWDRWILKGRDGFVSTCELVFASKAQAWAEAENQLRGHHMAEGPHGVAAIVGPVPLD